MISIRSFDESKKFWKNRQPQNNRQQTGGGVGVSGQAQTATGQDEPPFVAGGPAFEEEPEKWHGHHRQQNRPEGQAAEADVPVGDGQNQPGQGRQPEANVRHRKSSSDSWGQVKGETGTVQKADEQSDRQQAEEGG